MAQYPKITITNAGLNMIAESQGGTSIIFTKMVMGDGLLADGENIKVMTNVKNAMLAVPLQGFTNQNDGQIRLRFTVSNSNLETGFFAREIGVFAKMGATGAEQLYAYTNAGNKSDYLPDKSVPLDSQILDLYLVVGNATNISAVLDGNASYATKLDMTEHDISETAHSVIINNLKTKIESAGINLRKNSKTYVVGDVSYSLNLPTWARLDCIQGGTTASTEPTWGNVTAGQVFTDGTVQWRIADVKSSGDSVGSIKPWLVKSIPAGWLDISTGAMVSRATYPELWAWVQANAPLISEADWQTQANAQSSVGAFSTGDGSTTFRLPRIVDYVRGGILADVGNWQGDAIRNITGSLTNNSEGMTQANISQTECLGAMRISEAKTVSSYGSSNGENTTKISFDASLVVPVADENRPKTIKMIYCIKAFGTPVNQGLIDITALANEMVGKVNQIQYDAEHGFAIIYPNGGTKTSPANIAVNSRYICDNPFPGDHVVCEAQTYRNSEWCSTAWSYTYTSSGTYVGSGVRAVQLLPSDKIIVQTGQNFLSRAGNIDGSGFSDATQPTSSQCRVKVWKVGGKIE